MAHVHLAVERDGRARLTVDGIDIAPHILAEGCMIDLSHGQPRVTMTLVPDSLEGDLPEAMLEVLRQQKGGER